MNISALQQIRVVDVDQIETYTWSDSDSPELSLADINFIRHPFLVMALDDTSYLLLDDTDYFDALVRAGLRHFPVQVCRAEQLEMTGRRLGLLRFTSADLTRLTARQSERIQLSPRADDLPSESGYLTLRFDFLNEPSIYAHLRHSARSGCPAPLDAIFRAILQHGEYFPLVTTGRNDSLIRGAAFTGAVTIPPFSFDDLRCAATSDRTFPPGTVGIRSSSRVLDIDFPMSVLTASTGVEEKESFLSDLISLRVRSRRISYYEGQIYLLNL